MKFELNPYNRNISNKILIEDLQRIAKKLKKDSITIDLYEKYGKYNSCTLRRRFGSWFNALSKAGLKKTRNLNIPKEVCIQDLQSVAKKLGKKSVTRDEYKEHGRFSPTPLIRHCGSWFSALETAGLNKTREYQISEEEYFKNLENIWRTIGRQPYYSEVRKPLSKYSAGAYEYKFGSWRKALEAFVKFVNNGIVVEKPSQKKPKQTATKGKKKITKNSRTISWRLRFLVMRRDEFKCCQCGRSPANTPGVILHIDHKTPWTKGGSTKIANLQTLCEKCNIGKSNLSLKNCPTTHYT